MASRLTNKVIAQDRQLQSGIYRIRGSFRGLTEHIHPFQDECIGFFLFLAEPVNGQTVVFQQQIRCLGRKPGRGDPLRGCQIHLHQISGKGHGLFFRSVLSGQFQIPLEMAHKALGINGNAQLS